MLIYLLTGFILVLLAEVIKRTLLPQHESYSDSQPIAETKPLDENSRNEIINLLSKKKKIEAIKLYRNATGSGLKQSKNAVEQIAIDNRYT